MIADSHKKTAPGNRDDPQNGGKIILSPAADKTLPPGSRIWTGAAGETATIDQTKEAESYSSGVLLDRLTKLRFMAGKIFVVHPAKIFLSFIDFLALYSLFSHFKIALLCQPIKKSAATNCRDRKRKTRGPNLPKNSTRHLIITGVPH